MQHIFDSKKIFNRAISNCTVITLMVIKHDKLQ